MDVVFHRPGRRRYAVEVVPKLRARVDDVAWCWAAVGVGSSMRLTWSLVDRRSGR